MKKWDGKALPGTIIAVSGRDSEVSEDERSFDFLVLADAADQSVMYVESQQLGPFLEVHKERIFVGNAVAGLHWKLVEWIKRSGHEKALDDLWNLPRNGQLHDVMLLDQRLRVVKQGVFPIPHSLETLVERYCFDKHLNRTQELHVILAIYKEQLAQAAAISSRLANERHIVDHFCPLGHGLDVQGAIAVENPQRVLHIHLAAAKHLQRDLEKLHAESSRQLKQEHDADHALEWDGDLVARDSKGFPKYKLERVRKWLKKQLAASADVNDQSWPDPLDDKGNFSSLPEHWDNLVDCSRRLRAWSDLCRSAQALRFFQSLAEEKDDWSFRPKYRVVPRLHAFEPELSHVHPLTPGLFCPGEKQRMLVYRLADLEIRCLGFVCEQYRHTSRIAVALRDGEDVIAILAENLADIANNDEVDDDGQELPDLTSNQWEQVVEVLLDSVARGYSTDQICVRLRNATERDHWPAAQVLHLYILFKNQICPELTDLLNDQTVDQVARNLGTPSMLLYEKLLADSVENRPSFRFIGATLRNVILRKSTAHEYWQILRELAKDTSFQEAIDAPCDNEYVHNLLQRWPVTPLGRVGSPAYISQSRSREVLDFADDVLKLILFEIAAAGFLIVAVNGPEFVIATDVQTDSEEAHTKVREAAEKAVQKLQSFTCCKRPIPWRLDPDIVHTW